jgi:hypothetical protein
MKCTSSFGVDPDILVKVLVNIARMTLLEKYLSICEVKPPIGLRRTQPEVPECGLPVSDSISDAEDAMNNRQTRFVRIANLEKRHDSKQIRYCSAISS